MNGLVLAIALTLEFPPQYFALPSFAECTRELENARKFAEQIRAYAEEMRQAERVAPTFATRWRLMEAEEWERIADRRADAWEAATWVTWPKATRAVRWSKAARTNPVLEPPGR